jgi:hypothetical protein
MLGESAETASFGSERTPAGSAATCVQSKELLDYTLYHSLHIKHTRLTPPLTWAS